MTLSWPRRSLSDRARKGRVGVIVREGRYGTFCSIEMVDHTFGAKWITDAELAYRNTRTFPRNAPFGFNGRYVYGRLAIAM